MLNKIIKYSSLTLITICVAIMFWFITINFLLNCQTWDKDLWTEKSSCVTIPMVLGIK
jgi:hypothetical protein